MKLLVIPDPHCWAEPYSRPRADGRPSRLHDWEGAADAIRTLARDEKPDAILCVGDTWNSPHPTPQAVEAVHGMFAGMERRCPVIAIEGNHTAPAPGRVSPSAMMAEIAGRPLWGITEPQVRLIHTAAGHLAVCCLPWMRPANLLGQTANSGEALARMNSALEAITRGLVAEAQAQTAEERVAAGHKSGQTGFCPVVVLGHWAIAGSRLSSGAYMQGGEASLDLSFLQALPVEAVIMGHIHRPQIWRDHPVVLHAGAMQRRDFGEEKDKRGCWILDLQPGTATQATWHALPERNFLTIDMALHDSADPLMLYAACEGAPEGAIVRVMYSAPADLAKVVDHDRILKALRARQVDHIAGIFPDIQRADRVRAAGLTEQSRPLDALDGWLSSRSDIPEALCGRVRAAGAKLLAEHGLVPAGELHEEVSTDGTAAAATAELREL